MAQEEPTEQAGGDQRVQTAVKVDESKLIAMYANFCRVTGTPEELIIDFGLNCASVWPERRAGFRRPTHCHQLLHRQAAAARLAPDGAAPRSGLWRAGNRRTKTRRAAGSASRPHLSAGHAFSTAICQPGRGKLAPQRPGFFVRPQSRNHATDGRVGNARRRSSSAGAIVKPRRCRHTTLGMNSPPRMPPDTAPWYTIDNLDEIASPGCSCFRIECARTCVACSPTPAARSGCGPM